MVNHLLLLNLERRPDRLKAFETQYQSLKSRNKLRFIQDWRRVEAVDQPSSPSLGCMASHLKAIEYAQEQKWVQVLVAEDDILFPEDVDERFATLCQSWPPHWSVIFGGCSQVLNLAKYNAHFAELQGRSVATGTHCMIYHQSAYEGLIEMFRQELKGGDPMFPTHIDLVMCMQAPLLLPHPLFVTWPFLGYFITSKSDVGRSKSEETDQEQLLLAESQVKYVLSK